MLKKGLWIAGVCALSIGLTACSAASPPAQHALPVTKIFAIDKAGSTTTIDFEVVPGVNIRRRLMVALDFPQTQDWSIEGAIQQQNVSMRIQIFYDDHGKLTPIATQDDASILKSHYPGPAVSAGTMARLNLYATDGKTSNVLISGFYVTHYGHYKATLTTVQDQPMFKNVKTIVRVDEFYNTGL